MKISYLNRAQLDLALHRWFASSVQPGDLVLVGGRNPVARMVQRGLRTEYSHAALVTDRGSVVESYDYRLTLREDDDGVVETSFSDFLDRHDRVSVLSVYRPRGLDVDAVLAQMNQVTGQVIPYPTAGIAILAVAVWMSRLAGKQRPGSLREQALRRLVEKQLVLAADGPERMHCGEFIIRLYWASGLKLQFQSVADDHPAYSRLTEPHAVLPPPRPKGRSGRQAANRPTRPSGRTTVLWCAICATYDFGRALAARRRNPSHIDMADFVFPGDLSSADPMLQIGKALVDHQQVSISYEIGTLP